MDKPQVEEIRGIPPAIAIEQTNTVRTTRSTVGTMTEINDYLKLLFPRLAAGTCPDCSQPVQPDTPQTVAAAAYQEFPGQTLLVTLPVPVPPKTTAADFFPFLQAQGYLRVLLYGETSAPTSLTAIKKPPSRPSSPSSRTASYPIPPPPAASSKPSKPPSTSAKASSPSSSLTAENPSPFPKAGTAPTATSPSANPPPPSSPSTTPSAPAPTAAALAAPSASTSTAPSPTTPSPSSRASSKPSPAPST